MNRLKEETSPYLRQHLDNPVDWYPWGKEALEVAKETGKPILLSVGYSACHWCHVMAHESFEDKATAEVMNQNFINIKVDREERPDIDAIYMQAVTSMTGHGGWPMTVFLTPDTKPFYGGTYFPKVARTGMPSFVEILNSVSKSWKEQKQELLERADKITALIKETNSALSSMNVGQPHSNISASASRLAAIRELQLSADPAWGGFGRAPKFPQSMLLEFLLAHLAVSGNVSPIDTSTSDTSPTIDNDDIYSIAKTHLDAMASGGIYDHLGGGFCRYSTDIFWLTPHFEKMLYDNALLTKLYLNAYQLTKKPRYKQVAKECRKYLLRDLYDKDTGGFYSAEDADSQADEKSQAKEGVFYIWSHDEFVETINKHLDERKSENKPELLEQIKNWYGVTEAGNFKEHADDPSTNILFRRLRGDLKRSEEIEAARIALLKKRNERLRPLCDTKILTEWNAMTIQALAEMDFLFSTNFNHNNLDSDNLDESDSNNALGKNQSLAEKAGEFLYENLRKNGRWYRSFSHGINAGSVEAEDNGAENKIAEGENDKNKGGAKHLACASDYAQIILAFISLYSTSGKEIWLKRADETAIEMLELFSDDVVNSNGVDNSNNVEQGAMLFSTGKDSSDILFRPKDVYDNAIPSANSAGAIALMKLGALTGNQKYINKADEILDIYSGFAYQHPLSFGNALYALLLREVGIVQIVICGDEKEVSLYLEEYKKHFIPNAVLAFGEPTDSSNFEENIFNNKEKGKAYICKNFTCLEPADSVEKFKHQLENLS